MEAYADDVNYWKTGTSPPDAWLEKSVALLASIGATDVECAFGRDAAGRAAFMVAWTLNGERYRCVWPVLPPRQRTADNERAARIQAATMLYHDIKARVVSAKVLGARTSFFSFLMLPDGRTMSSLSTPELAARVPRLLIDSAASSNEHDI